jgi:mitogen-activated protein kinase kinase kinase 9
LQQKLLEENLRQREQELAAREIDLLERELHIMIIQQQTPTPKKRKGKFKRGRLKILKKEPGQNISLPSGEDANKLPCNKVQIFKTISIRSNDGSSKHP